MHKVCWLLALALLYTAVTSPTVVAARQQTTPAGASSSGVTAESTGEEIFRLACATCHAVDGSGSPQSVVGFALPLPNGHTFPDFNDCPTNTVEPFADWIAVVTRGGPIRALDRHMPAFGDALTAEQIERTVRYLGSFCRDKAWPRGDLNLPRAFFTEKAFPENETVWTTGVTGSDAKAVVNQLVYEHRIGARNQYEITVPFAVQQNAAGGPWARGLGDIELAFRRTFYASESRGSIFAAGGALTLPTGKETEGLGNGYRVYEPFAMWGQLLGPSGFLQLHAGYEIPSDQDAADNEAFLRTALGYTFAEDQGFGRAWTPMAELLVAKPDGGGAEWDVVPQMQISLSRLQHVLLSVGVRIPINEREERRPQFLTYFLWDWFDGGLFQFWK